jgi:hypothetical protein
MSFMYVGRRAHVGLHPAASARRSHRGAVAGDRPKGKRRVTMGGSRCPPPYPLPPNASLERKRRPGDKDNTRSLGPNESHVCAVAHSSPILTRVAW